ncbi:MAG TPA: hypothetical protein VNS32_27660 [Flavisolibacter sp.]|nr:hypothetical protein [Flavisolibacter sp.]HWJ90947.1 hypothetical protein [Flavisolibacter sp.]
MLEKLYQNNNFKVAMLSLKANQSIPSHKTASEVYFIVVKGKGQISFSDRQFELLEFTSIIIPSAEIHKVDAYEDLRALLVITDQAAGKAGSKNSEPASGP